MSTDRRQYWKDYYHQKKILKGKNKGYQQTFRDKEKMERKEEDRDEFTKLAFAEIQSRRARPFAHNHPPATPAVRKMVRTPTHSLDLSKPVFQELLNTP